MGRSILGSWETDRDHAGGPPRGTDCSDRGLTWLLLHRAGGCCRGFWQVGHGLCSRLCGPERVCPERRHCSGGLVFLHPL